MKDLVNAGPFYRYLIPEELREKARNYYRDLSRGVRITEYLIRDILAPYSDIRINDFKKMEHPGSILASVGIHPCSGCGADPERYPNCKQCDGSSWMHEVRCDKRDENAPDDIIAYRVKFIPGKFDGHEVGWHPVWWELVIKDID